MEVLKNLSDSLAAERGMGGGVCIWRRDHSEDYFFAGSVGEFLSDSVHQSGEWSIDGGWGGPPGPIVVRWSTKGHWINGGFCGRLLTDEHV